MEAVTTTLAIVFCFMCLYLFWCWFCFGNYVKRRQKTRNPQQRRMYVGSRPRQSLTQQEPTIYVSPSNLPPPPKYECMAPPSYEEVVGIHYPNYQIQPITQPINAALAQGPSHSQHDIVTSNVTSNVASNVTNSVTTIDETARAPVTITATAEPRPTSVTVVRP